MRLVSHCRYRSLKSKQPVNTEDNTLSKYEAICMPHLPGGATPPPMTAPESISYLESLNALVFCQKRLQMPRPWLVKLMTASLSQFFWIQSTSHGSIFLRQDLQTIIYVLELTSSNSL